MKEQTLIVMRGRDLATYGAKLHDMNIGQLVMAIADRHDLLEDAEQRYIRALRPAAWIRGVMHGGGPDGPPEYDEECVPGDDQPPGEGWCPLYSHPNGTLGLLAACLDWMRKSDGHIVDWSPMIKAIEDHFRTPATPSRTTDAPDRTPEG